jgi:hypothetical protein
LRSERIIKMLKEQGERHPKSRPPSISRLSDVVGCLLRTRANRGKWAAQEVEYFYDRRTRTSLR